MSFPDRFRTAQAYFAPKFEIECVHACILTLITRLVTTLSTTTTPAATAPPLPLVHLGISAFAFKSNWHESRWRVRNQSETSQKPAKRNLSLSLPCLCPHPPTPTPIPISTTTTATDLLLLVLLVLLWVFRTVSGPRKLILLPNLKSNAFTHGSWLITRFATTLSTTTTPAATAPPLPLVHLGISAFAFKSNRHESRWRVRNQSETSQKPAKRNHLFPPSLPLSLSFPPSPFLPLPCY